MSQLKPITTFIVCCLFASGSLCSAEPSTSQIRAQQLFKKASKSLITDGQMDNALTEIDQALALEPQSAVYWAEKAAILHNLDELELSLKASDQAIKLDPSLFEGWYQRARSFHDLGRNSEALPAVETAIKVNAKLSRSAQVLSSRDLGEQLRGKVLIGLGRYKEALEQLNSVLTKNSLAGTSINDRIRVCIRLEQWQQVVTDCTNLLSRDRSHIPDALNKRANAYAHLRKFKEAIADYQAVLRLAPIDHTAHNGLLDTYIKMNDTAAAARERKAITDLDEDLLGPSKH
jgi:tetratricopeptide (TPR) repeat protein